MTDKNVDETKSKQQDQAEALFGAFLLGSLITGLLALILAVAAMLESYSFHGGAVYLIAAALAFGLGSNAVLRK